MSRFIIRDWKIISSIIAPAVVIGFAAWVYLIPVTKVYIVRHAEKESRPDVSDTDLQLLPEGVARAEILATVLGSKGISAIYSSKERNGDIIKRTKQTTEPLAEHLELEIQFYVWNDTQGVADTILSNHRSEKVLVVGHSTTVDDIIEELGDPDTYEDLPENVYNKLFTVTISFFGTVSVDEQTYGGPNPPP